MSNIVNLKRREEDREEFMKNQLIKNNNTNYEYMDVDKCNKYYRLDYSINKSFNFYTLENCFISVMIRKNQVWEPEMYSIFDRFINKDSVVIECGCHIGIHTIKIASLCNKLYGFEPMPDTYEVLSKNIILNNVNNSIIYKKGVADKEGFTKYSWISDNNPGGSGLDNNPMGKPSYINSTDKNIEVELTTIDSLNLDKLDFIKIDVEGYEPLVIKGGINTIRRHKPVIIMEVWKDHFGNVDIDYARELFKGLIDIGYDITHAFGADFLFTPPQLNNLIVYKSKRLDHSSALFSQEHNKKAYFCPFSRISFFLSSSLDKLIKLYIISSILFTEIPYSFIVSTNPATG